jgi:hypothetical protein
MAVWNVKEKARRLKGGSKERQGESGLSEERKEKDREDV